MMTDSVQAFFSVAISYRLLITIKYWGQGLVTGRHVRAGPVIYHQPHR